MARAVELLPSLKGLSTPKVCDPIETAISVAAGGIACGAITRRLNNMTLEEAVEHTRLHDSQIDSIECKNNHLRLKFSDVCTDCHGGDYYNVVINMLFIEITRNGEKTDFISLESSESNVGSFVRSGDAAELAVFWINEMTGDEDFCLYKITFEAFDLQVFPQSEKP